MGYTGLPCFLHSRGRARVQVSLCCPEMFLTGAVLVQQGHHSGASPLMLMAVMAARTLCAAVLVTAARCAAAAPHWPQRTRNCSAQQAPACRT